MGVGNFSLELDLSTVMKGKLNEDFKQRMTEILGILKKGEKATVTIKVTVLRREDMDTIADVDSSIESKVPAKKRGSVALIRKFNGQASLWTDEPEEPMPDNVSLFDKKRAKEENINEASNQE
jgi:hypothetical protein